MFNMILAIAYKYAIEFFTQDEIQAEPVKSCEKYHKLFNNIQNEKIYWQELRESVKEYDKIPEINFFKKIYIRIILLFRNDLELLKEDMNIKIKNLIGCYYNSVNSFQKFLNVQCMKVGIMADQYLRSHDFLGTKNLDKNHSKIQNIDIMYNNMDILSYKHGELIVAARDIKKVSPDDNVELWHFLRKYKGLDCTDYCGHDKINDKDSLEVSNDLGFLKKFNDILKEFFDNSNQQIEMISKNRTKLSNKIAEYGNNSKSS